MSSEERSTLTGIFMALTAVILAILLVGRCTNQEAQIVENTKLACIKAGGNWEQINPKDWTPSYGCKVK